MADEVKIPDISKAINVTDGFGKFKSDTINGVLLDAEKKATSELLHEVAEGKGLVGDEIQKFVDGGLAKISKFNKAGEDIAKNSAVAAEKFVSGSKHGAAAAQAVSSVLNGEDIAKSLPSKEFFASTARSNLVEALGEGDNTWGKKLTEERFNSIVDKHGAYVKEAQVTHEKAVAEAAKKAHTAMGEGRSWLQRVGGHVEANFKGVSDGEKFLVEAKPLRMVAGSSVSLIGAGDGIRRVWNGVTGKENPETGEKDGWGTFALGAVESAASLALLSKVATGRVNAFRL